MNPSEDSDNIYIEEDNTIIRPTKPSHVDFDKSKIKGGHIEVLNCFGFVDNVEWVRESAFIPFVSFGDLDDNTFKRLTSLLSVE
jgi:hypothetical protein